MIVLGIESATDQAGVALASEAGVVASAKVAVGRRHTESLAPGIAWVCKHAGVELAEVDALALDAGPGLFTGLRVGAATAQGLAFALGVPVAMLASTEVLAAGASWLGLGEEVTAVVDARRGEVFWATFDASGRTSDDQVGPPEVLAEELLGRGGPRLLVGGGALRYEDELIALLPGARFGPEALGSPQPEIVALLGVQALAGARSLRMVEAREVAPSYLREADARVNWESRLEPLPAERSSAASSTAR